MNISISGLDKEILTFQKQHKELQKEISILEKDIAYQSEKLTKDIHKFNRHILTTTRLAHQQKGIPHLTKPQQNAVLQRMQTWLNSSIEKTQNKLNSLYQKKEKLNNKEMEFQKLAETLKTRKLKLNQARSALLKALKIKDSTLAKRLKHSQQKAPTLSPKTPQKIHSGTAITIPTKGLLITKYNEKNDQDIIAKGVTIQSRAQAPIVAVQNGTLLYAGDFRTYGGLIIIKTKNNQQHIYGGVEKYQFKVGDVIKTGQTIAFLPNIKNPNLYFETREKNKEFNPIKFLK